MSARLSDAIFHREDLRGNAGAFPFPAVAGSGGEVCGAKPKQLDAVDLAHLRHGVHCRNRFEDRHDEDMLVGLGGVLAHALPPAGGPFGADAPLPLGRVAGKRHRAGELLGRLDPGDHDPVGAEVEGPLDEAPIELRHPHQRHRITADGGPEVVGDLLPVELAVLGVDHHPVEPERHRHFGDRCRFERDPQPEDRLVAGELGTKIFERGGFHGVWCVGFSNQ